MIKKISKRLNNKKGFTLIELIVVIAILGILAAMVVPKFGGFTDTAKQRADEVACKTIEKAVLVAIANGDIIPGPKDGTITIANGNDGKYGSNVISTKNNKNVEDIMKPLVGDEVKSQTGTGFTVTIEPDGDVKAAVK